MKRLPLILRWPAADDLPTRLIQPTQKSPLVPSFATLSCAESGQPAGRLFDFGAAVHRLIMDIAIRCPDFRHLQTPRILVSATQARGAHAHGLQARVTPLRFAKGALVRQRRGVPYHLQRFFLGEHEYLYLMTFCLPRFLDQDFDHKFITVFHELYHIGPAFDGDLRRHEGRYHVHSHSQRDYDERMVEYARAYLAGRPDPSIHGFLRMSFAQLHERHGGVRAIVVPRPKMIPVIASR